MKNKKPTTLFICCCDHRVIPYSFAGKEPGELFILRNIGNIVPPIQSFGLSIEAAIEYALENLKCPQIIVCGHSDCGGMKAVLAPSKEYSVVGDWLKFAAKPDGLTSPDDLSKSNVLEQIKHLKRYLPVAAGLKKKTLSIKAWWLDLETNMVYCFDEQTGEWAA